MGVLSAAATLVNPYGFKLHVHIYRYLSNRFLMDHIDEFQSPNFHYVAQKCFAGLLLLTLLALAGEKTRGRREPGPGGVVRGVCGVVCVTEHSCVVTAVDSGDWAVVVGRDGKTRRHTLMSRERNSMARDGLDIVPSANEGRSS